MPRRRVEKNLDEGLVLPILNHAPLKLSLTCHLELRSQPVDEVWLCFLSCFQHPLHATDKHGGTVLTDRRFKAKALIKLT